jgi:maltokinase
MLPIDMSLLAGWLPQQRWFGGKGAAIASVRDVDRAQISPGLVLATVEIWYREGRPPERYALALKPWTGVPGIVEGLDDDAARALLGIVREKRRIATAAGALQGLRFDTRGSELDELTPSPRVRRLSAEQSNTSVVFDDKVIVKLIRRLEPGVNPELEMGAFLARRGFTATPPLLGGIALEGAVNATAAVAHRVGRVVVSARRLPQGRAAARRDQRSRGARRGDARRARLRPVRCGLRPRVDHPRGPRALEREAHSRAR